MSAFILAALFVLALCSGCAAKPATLEDSTYLDAVSLLQREVSVNQHYPEGPEAEAVGLAQLVSTGSNARRELVLNFDVYYESKCPYSMEVIKDLHTQLLPFKGEGVTWNLNLYPFGNAMLIPMSNISEGYKFWHQETFAPGQEHVILCQHDEEECLGNMIHLCAMHLNGPNGTFSQQASSPHSYLPYLQCMADPDTSVERNSIECLDHWNVPWASGISNKTKTLKAEKLHQCVSSKEASAMMAQVAKKSGPMTPERNYVPWVNLNGMHVTSAEKGKLLNLLCTSTLGSGVLPEMCQGMELLQGEAKTKEPTDQLARNRTSTAHGKTFAAHTRLDLVDAERGHITMDANEALAQVAKDTAAMAQSHKQVVGSCEETPSESAKVPVPPGSTAELTDYYNRQATAQSSKAATTSQSGSSSAALHVADAGKMRLRVMYESQCPYSLMFIQDLEHAVADLFSNSSEAAFNKVADLQMLPYGNAKTVSAGQLSDGYKLWHPVVKSEGIHSVFKCQHGESECLGNMIQMCAMTEKKHKPTEYLPFLGCMAKNPSWSVEKSSYECAKQYKIDLHRLKDCVFSAYGNQEMTKVGEITNAHEGKSYVPYISVNGIHAKSAEQGYLKRILCTGLLGLGHMPQACDSVHLLQTAATVKHQE
eukprot:gnl/TRDRNA2_/TRDRNA2_188843_c0_seq1.p1 gnl/TRDRNA2_/TRDRNA2_188843_c0~~gnl/TRDRNA2_/TRDRNA2_188843_c0_seq1.p1  ORF type:complete len:650 (+),score=112.59 gnl/TRDRNA2_/TRDRNA2_188843_c0_seq1:89-2038(+)